MKQGKLLMPGLAAAGLGVVCGMWSGGNPRRHPAGPSPAFRRDPPGAGTPDPLNAVRNLLTDSGSASLTGLARLLPRLSAGEVWSLLETLNASAPAPGSVGALAAGHLADRLAQLDPERVWQAFSKFAALERPVAAVLGRAAALSGDPARCRDWAGRIGSDEARGDFWQSLAAAAGDSLGDVVREGGAEAIASWAARLAGENVASCQAWAADHPETWAAAAGASAAAGDPRQALDWVRGLPENPAKAAARSKVYAAWMAKDPAAALAAFGADESPQQVSWALHDMGREMAARPPETIIAAIAAQPDAAFMKFGQTGSLAGRWLREWVDRDPRETVATLFAMPDTALRHDLIAKATLYWNLNSSADLRTRLESAVSHEPPGETRDAVITALARGSARTGDAAGAFRFLEQQPAPNPEARAENFRLAAEDLITSAPAALAGNWEKLPAAVQEEQRAGLLESWRKMDPAAAGAWERRHPAP